jgi:hypothetical protein
MPVYTVVNITLSFTLITDYDLRIPLTSDQDTVCLT